MNLDFCVSSASAWQLAGYALFILKVLVPLIIIIMGVIDFVKALTANKDDAINAAVKSVLIRFIVGIVIFFIPLIISTIFTLIKDASPFIAKGDACQLCLLRPFSDGCSGYKETAKAYYDSQRDENSEEHNYEVYIEGCYKCGDGYIWTNNPGAGCTKLERETSTGAKFTKALCEEVNNDPSRQGHTSTAQKNDDDDDETSAGSSSGGSSSQGSSSSGSTSTNKTTKVIFVGDSIMNGICSNNNLTPCFYCAGGGLDWLNTSTGRCTNSNASANVVNDAAEQYEGENYTNYTIVVYLGTNDVTDSNSASSLASRYLALSNKEWRYAKIVVLSLVPMKYENVGSINQTALNNFNSKMESQIKAARITDKITYCNLGITRSDLVSDNNYDSDGLHLNSSGYKKLYTAIQNKCI